MYRSEAECTGSPFGIVQDTAMTRMSREFSLVLLGAGLLTAGYFAWPEQDFERRACARGRSCDFLDAGSRLTRR